MKKQFTATLMLLLCTAVFAAKHPDCVAGRLGTIEFLDNDSDDELAFLAGRPSLGARYGKLGDICQLSDAKTPAELKALRKQLSDLNIKAAKALGVDIKKLLPEQLNVEFSGSALGPYDSSSGNPLQLFVFPTWGLPGKPQTFDSGIYLHEVGHNLIENESPAVPKAITDLGSSDFLSESIPDLLGASVAGALAGNIDKLPSCIPESLRPGGNAKGYKGPLSYFVSGYAHETSVKCCEKLQRENKLKDESEFFCKEILDVRPDSPWLKVNRELQVADIIKTPKDLNLDVHQMGIPFKDLFTKLAGVVKDTPLNILLKAAPLIKSNKMGDPMVCSIKKLEPWMKPVKTNLVHFGHLLKAVESTLSAPQKKSFETMKKALGVDLGIELIKAELKGGTTNSVFYDNYYAKTKAYAKIMGTPEGAELKATGCFKKLDDDDEWYLDQNLEGCKTSCSFLAD